MSDPLTIKVRKLHREASLPAKWHPDDAAFDLFALESMDLGGGAVHRVRTGIATEMPAGWYAQIRGRSSLASRGVTPLGGVIDASYRGEWVVCLQVPDLGGRVLPLRPGDRIAQFTLHEVPAAVVVEVDELTPTPRGAGGFGSTGR